MVELSEVLVLSGNVLDRLAIKFTLCTKLGLTERVHFVSSNIELKYSLLSQAQDS